MKTLLKKYFIYLMVSLISLLLLANILFTNSNNAIIEQNRALQREAIAIRARMANIGSRLIQAADIGLRGYAIIPETRFAEPLDTVILIQQDMLDAVVAALDNQHYPSNDYRHLRDSIKAYVAFCDSLRHLIDSGDRPGFLHAFTADKGLSIWEQYEQCRDSINAFEDLITQQAEQRYEAALWRNYLLQIVLFVICFPTLLYTAFHTQKTVELHELLRLTEADKNQELKHANQELVQQNNQLEQFAFIAAHNLRSPLARILGLAHLLEFPTEAHDSAAVIKRMVDATKDLDHVIRDLNTILDIKKHTSNLTDIDLSTALARVTKTLEREIDETQATVRADFSAASHVQAVPPYIESILFNLLSNAIKYRKPGHPPQISVRTQADGADYVVMRVSDNGLGIDLEKHSSSIFSLYKRFHLHTEGRGLGLYLIKTQMTAVGGHVEVESTPGEGTTFILYFRKNQPA